ncbi:MAG: excinuclease ABC subunit UvrA, partial [Bacilli bacterium]|nr:excinuclease ABC subunit UvrA [Bacilli bacterium]
ICGFSVPPIEPRIFSFNNPLGCCEDCNGLGVKVEASPDLLVPNQNLTLNEGAIKYYAQKGEETIEKHELNALCAYYKIPMDVPYRKLSEQQKNILMYGPKDVVTYTYESINGSLYKKTITEGIKTKIDRLYNSTTSSMMKEYYSSFMATRVCPSCKGARLNKKVLAIKVGGKNIYELCSMSLDKLLDFFNNIELSASEAKIAELVIAEIKNRLKFLIDVGLEYLTLARSAMSLSGGEAQRIRLATQIGSKLTGVLYVLDEPSIGLHQRDNDKLIATLKEMRDLGNSLIVVEHDEDTMREADFLVDIGPGAGEHGGEIVFAGKPEEINKATNSLTADYLLGRKKIEVPSFRRPGVREVVIKGARCHNLKDIDVTFKTGCLNLVTGVSGSGKSSLVTEILYKKVRQHLGIGKEEPGECDGIEGIEYFDKVINVSQEPIGKTPRSNPATYVKVFDDIRELFALTKEARAKGFDKSTFSFNVKGGRCEACQGDGVKRISMNFLPDVYVECDECHGKRYTEEVLEVHYKGKNIYDVLNMRVEEAYEFFKNIPSIERKLKTLMDVGLSYIKLGQSSTTLSGGEAQRVKLAYELERPSTSSTLYILDEPTTGLHVSDIKYLMNVFNRLVDEGNTVVVIEHNLDVIKCADYIVDLGPEGGDNGGTLVATGTPEEIANNKKSYTGQYLKRYLKKEA